MHLVIALILTILIELGVLLLLKERRIKVLLSSVAVNVLTNVPLNLYLASSDYTWSRVVVCELIVVAIESLWYLCFTGNFRQSVIYSFLCNAVCFLVGLLLVIIVEYVLLYC